MIRDIYKQLELLPITSTLHGMVFTSYTLDGRHKWNQPNSEYGTYLRVSSERRNKRKIEMESEM